MAIIRILRSPLVPGIAGMGEMRLLAQRIKRILKILDPMTFPSARSVFFLYAATAEVASSGSEVPIAIMVRPIILSLIPKLFAIKIAPFTIHSPPKMSPANPSMIHRSDFQIGSCLISSCSSSSVPFLTL